jgi:ASC-1-like (ASCH) protein
MDLVKTAKQAAEVWHILQHRSKVSPGDTAIFNVLFLDMVKMIMEEANERKNPSQIQLPM